jgi:SAM-dependent methyltransferase
MKNYLKSLKTRILKEQFDPSFFGIFVNPFYFVRKAIYTNVKINSSEIKGVILDIGCGSKPYEKLFVTDKYIGIDVKVSGHDHSGSQVDIYYDGLTIPFENESFDSIVCFEVIEHVFNPDILLSEAFRVLKPGGKAMFTAPFVWDEHEQPYDFARYSSFGLKYIFEKNGFTVVKNIKYLCDLRLFSVLTNAYFYKVLKKFNNRLSNMMILMISSINNIFGHIIYLFPKNPDLYYGNMFILKK